MLSPSLPGLRCSGTSTSSSSSQLLVARARRPTLLLLPPRARSQVCNKTAAHLRGAPRAGGSSLKARREVVCSSSFQADGGGGLSAPAGVSFAQLPISTQALTMAFQVLDKDEDGRISRSEACRLVAYYLALQQHKPPSSQRRALTWDQHLLSSIAAARKLSSGGSGWGGVAAACEAFVGAKLSGGLQPHPPRCSDLVWSAAGMAAAVLVLGTMAAAAQTLPAVGQWHQQGVPLLLGSFGTLAILLFGKPEAEPVRLWPIIAGQLGATAIVMAVLRVCGASLASRAAAMAATVTWMMWSDCIHPPGGALVLMAMDDAAIQSMSWAYLLWPSLALSLAVLLPISAATNWLRRSYVFDAPWAAPGSGAATLQQKVRDWQQQQAAKQAAVLRQYRALQLDRAAAGGLHMSLLHEEWHSPATRLRRVFGPLLSPILQLLSFPRYVRQQQQKQHKQQKPRGWGVITAGGRTLHVRGVCLDLGPVNLAGSGMAGASGSAEAAAAAAAAAAALEQAIRRRLMHDDRERRYEDGQHRDRIWGGADQVSADLKRALEGKAADSQQQQQPPPPTEEAGEHEEEGGLGLSNPRQRLEAYWMLRAQLAEREGGSSGRAMDSFAPDELE